MPNNSFKSNPHQGGLIQALRDRWAYAILLAMVLTSTDSARRRLGRWWTVLHRVGMWGFFFILVLSPYADALLALKTPYFNPLTDPYTLAGVAALAVRIAAWWRSRMMHLRRVNEAY